jgi:hypothetical protein
MVPELENIEKEIQELEKNDAEKQIWIQNIGKIKAVVAVVQSEAVALSLEKDGHVIEDRFVDQKDKIDPEDTATKDSFAGPDHADREDSSIEQGHSV